MRKRILMILAAAMMPLLAQPPTAGRGPGGPGGAGRLEYLAGYLNLTEAQKTSAKAIFDAADTAATAQRGRVASAQDALAAGIKAGTSDAQLDTLAAALGSAQGGMEAIRAKAEVKFRALLTADQKAKLDTAAARGPGMGRNGRGGGPRQ